MEGGGPGAVASPPPQAPNPSPLSPSPAAPCRCAERTHRRAPAHPGRWAGRGGAGPPPIGCGTLASAALRRPLADAAGTTAAIPPGGTRNTDRIGSAAAIGALLPAIPGMHEGTRRRRCVVYIKSFYFVPTEIPGWGQLLYGVTTQRGTGGYYGSHGAQQTRTPSQWSEGGRRHCTYRCKLLLGRSGAPRAAAPRHLFTARGAAGAQPAAVGTGSPARNPGARIAVGMEMNRWRRERGEKQTKKKGGGG